MQILKREEQKIEDTWAIEDLYINEQAFQGDGIKLDYYIDEIKGYEGQLQKDAKTLLACLNCYCDANELLENIYVYANQNYHTDTANPKFQSMAGEAEIKMNLLNAAESFIVPEILKIPNDILDKFYEDEPELVFYKLFINEIIRQKKHTLDEKGERLLAGANELAKSASNIYSMFHNADIKFQSIEDENGVELPLTQGTFISYMESSNQNIRKSAFHNLYQSYEAHKNSIAAMFDANARAKAFYARERHYEDALTAALFDSEIPTDVYKNLIEAVHQNLDSMYSYLKLRKEALAINELHMYDIYTPLVESVNHKYTFEEAKDLVLEGLAPLGEEYCNRLKEGFDNRWIDVYENEGKRTGAYSWGAYGTHPYVLLNYNNTLKDVFTLAHEMGHALHSYYSDATQSYLYASYKIFVAEVASICNETLLIHYLLNNTKNKKEKAYLLNYFLDQFKGTLFRQTMFAEFEMNMHQFVKEGKTLTAQILCDEYYALNKLYFGKDCIVDKEISYEWARIPHFYTPFYVYQYATGFAAAIAIADKIMKKEKNAVENYIKFLSSGSSKNPIELLKICGIDMTKKDAVEQSLALFKDYIEQANSYIIGE